MAFIIKHSQDIKPQKKPAINNKVENNEVMDKISMAEQIINDTPAISLTTPRKGSLGTLATAGHRT